MKNSWLVIMALCLGLLTTMVGCSDHESLVTSPADNGQSQVQEGGQRQQLQESATSDQVAWWRNLTQSQRNAAIVSRGYADNGKYVGLNCKEWARKVVYDASKTVVWLPSTLPDANGWYFAPSSYLYGCLSVYCISAVKPGYIVQMQWRQQSGAITPHTMIVTGVTSTGFSVIESNWIASNTVGTRSITFNDFYKNVVKASMYYVVG